MKKNRIPGIDLEINPIGLGTWVMGGWCWGDAQDRDSEEAIEVALTEGVNLIDTAPIYGFGRAEKIVGRVLKQTNRRDQVVLSTKFGLEWSEDTRFIRRNSKKQRLMAELDQSRRRLQTDTIDIYHVHWPDFETDFGETFEVLHSFYEAGIIRAIGVSNFSLEQLRKAREYAPIHVVQPPYNLFEREMEETVLKFCFDEAISMLTYGALCRGLLSGKFKKEDSFSAQDIRSRDPKFAAGTLEKYLGCIEALSEIAQSKKCSLSQLAIAWVLGHGAVTAALVGARTAGQVLENIGALNIALAPEERKQMNNLVEAMVPDSLPAGFMAPPKSGVKLFGGA